MPRGQKREEREIAQERLEKQERRVEKLVELVDKLDRELREARIELSNEQTILKYYSQHPALEQPVEKVAKEMGWGQETLWPADEGQTIFTKGVTGAEAAENVTRLLKRVGAMGEDKK